MRRIIVRSEERGVFVTWVYVPKNAYSYVMYPAGRFRGWIVMMSVYSPVGDQIDGDGVPLM